ncbi:hypothetical protein GLW20_01720 [Virgibacillus halodenitrificans]|nr:hypothetical protein [Virgibacillus halodenitrificans]
MKKRTNNFKYVKIYHSKHVSFKELKESSFFSSFINYLDTVYSRALVESLINIVRDFNAHDSYDMKQFYEFVENTIQLIEINYDVEVPNDVVKEISSELYSIYQNNQFSHFRGQLLEYLIVYLEKNNNCKIYHEPKFYHKRKRFFKRKFEGSNCLIDVVKVRKRSCDVILIECKANIDNHIKRIGNQGEKFTKKLRLMDSLEGKLSTYIDENENQVKVTKNLASIKQPILKLPVKYTDYNYINLLDHFIFKNKMLI